MTSGTKIGDIRRSPPTKISCSYCDMIKIEECIWCFLFYVVFSIDKLFITKPQISNLNGVCIKMKHLKFMRNWRKKLGFEICWQVTYFPLIVSHFATVLFFHCIFLAINSYVFSEQLSPLHWCTSYPTGTDTSGLQEKMERESRWPRLEWTGHPVF